MKPNILFLFPDQWRGDWWSGGGHGVPVNTPIIAELARTGTVFSSAITPSPLCAPARACLSRGARYVAEGVHGNNVDYPVGTPTVYRALRDAGYHVTGCGKFDLHKAHYTWGPDGSHLLDEWGFSAGIDNEGKVDGVEAYKKGTPGPYLRFLEERGRAQVHVDDFAKRLPHGTFPTALSPEEYCDNWITENALRLLSEAPADQPWFLQVNWSGPHDPFDVTDEMHEWYAHTDFDLPFSPSSDNTDHLWLRRNYAAMIENIDKGIGRILNHPRVRENRENTLIVFASDHGEMLGDHGYFGKCTPHNGSVHVPLIIEGPGVQEGRRVEEPVTILDLTSTFTDVAEAEQLLDSDSLSLSACLNGSSAPRNVVTSALKLDRSPDFRWNLAMDDRFKYFCYDDGREFLYDRDDYAESENVSREYPEDLVRLRTIVQVE